MADAQDKKTAFKCFNCGGVGHSKKECPSAKKEGKNEGQQRKKGAPQNAKGKKPNGKKGAVDRPANLSETVALQVVNTVYQALVGDNKGSPYTLKLLRSGAAVAECTPGPLAKKLQDASNVGVAVVEVHLGKLPLPGGNGIFITKGVSVAVDATDKAAKRIDAAMLDSMYAVRVSEREVFAYMPGAGKSTHITFPGGTDVGIPWRVLATAVPLPKCSEDLKEKISICASAAKGSPAHLFELCRMLSSNGVKTSVVPVLGPFSDGKWDAQTVDSLVCALLVVRTAVANNSPYGVPLKQVQTFDKSSMPEDKPEKGKSAGTKPTTDKQPKAKEPIKLDAVRTALGMMSVEELDSIIKTANKVHSKKENLAAANASDKV